MIDQTTRALQPAPLNDEIAYERTTVMQNTWDWWRTAHRRNNRHHQNFRGYCIWCPNPAQTAWEQRDQDF